MKRTKTSVPSLTTKLTVVELKKKYGAVSSNFLFGIKEPPDFQCEFIDKIKDDIKDIFNTLKSFMEKNESSTTTIAPILVTLKDMLNQMENRRTAFEELREIGDEWKDLAKKAIGNDAKKYLKINLGDH